MSNYANRPKIVVAMSGGVDSSVAAVLLKKQGFDVIGVFLKFWKPPPEAIQTGTNRGSTNRYECFENVCCSKDAADSARSVAGKLEIPFYVLDASKEFKAEVVDYYIGEYESGRTPNPCVACNKFIKFGWLLRKAKELGAEFIATGHYARIARKLKNKNEKGKTTTKNLKLLKAKDRKKDQSYFLWQLSQDQLRHTLFPIGDFTKEEVRKIARKLGLPTADRKESQNVCFVPDGDNYKFISKYAGKLTKPGNIVDSNGNILGYHKGLAYYTIGQRHGLVGIQLKEKGKRKKEKVEFSPAYVVKLNMKKNELVVGEKKDLFSRELIAEKVHFLRNTCLAFGEPRRAKLTKYEKMKCNAKIRYGHKAENCYIVYPEYCRRVKLPAPNGVERSNCRNEIKVVFEKPQRAITPGQSVVFYHQNELIGGGIIK